MKVLTWKEALFGSKGLKQYREENNIVVPEEYIISTWRVASALIIHVGILAFAIGLFVMGVYLKVI